MVTLKPEEMSNDQIAEQYGLIRQYSATTGEPFDVWLRADKALYIRLEPDGEYQICTDINDSVRVGHIKFYVMKFRTFRDAASMMASLYVAPADGEAPAVWEPTMRLKWVHQPVGAGTRNAVMAGSSHEFGHFGQQYRLVQLWKSNDGKAEWRVIEVDIPKSGL